MTNKISTSNSKRWKLNLDSKSALIATWLVALATVGLLVSDRCNRSAERAEKSSDEHVNTMIDTKLNPAIDKINGHIDSKVDQLSTKIDGLSDRVSRIEGSLGKRISGLETRANQQQSLAKIYDPDRALAQIRRELQFAEKNGGTLGPEMLVDYKNAVSLLPTSANAYWKTVAAIINYQSLLNQMNGNAPDPSAVAKPCAGLTKGTGGGNIFAGGGVYKFSNCIVDLNNSNVYEHARFENCVVHYDGGPVLIGTAEFINCRFVVDIPDVPKSPIDKTLLLALLNSPNQRNIRVSFH